MKRSDVQRQGSLLLIGIVTLAFAWVVWPFLGAIFWAVVLAILLEPIHHRVLAAVRQRRTFAALATVVVFVLVVGVPLAVIGALVLRQATAFYAQVASVQLDFGADLARSAASLRSCIFVNLDAIGLDNF